MTSLTKLFGFRDARRPRRSRSHRVARRDLRLEGLETRTLLAVTVPPSITSDTVEIDDNVVVSNSGGGITATGGPGTSGHVQIFGNSKGRIDGTPGQSNEDLTIVADSFITVTGGIGGIQRLDDLTLTSVTAQPINLQQVVSLTGDLRVTKAGAFTIGSTVTIDGDLVIDEAALVTFAGNVTVGGDLTITKATGVTFAGTLTVGGAITIANSTGNTRFMNDVSVGSAAITSTSLVQVMADFTTTAASGDGDVTFTTDQVNFTTASVGVDSAATGATLVIRPRTTSRALTIASPPGTPAGLNITDADITAIQPGWKRVVFGDEGAGTGAVRIGSIGSQYGGFSQILNTTTIVGGTVQVVQPVDVAPLAIYLELIARGTGTPGSGSVTIDAPINQTEGERSVWVRLESAGSIAINAPVWADQIVSLTTTAGGTIAQGGTAAAITTPALAVDADGAVTLADSGNAVGSVAIKTTDDSLVLRNDVGYVISPITTIDDGRDSRPTATVTGIDVGAGTARLVTVSGGTISLVDQSRAILAAAVGLEGAGTKWNLSLVGNDIGTLAANTGWIVFRDIDDLTIGTVAAVTPRSELFGITVERTLQVTAATTLTITAAGDIISAASSGTAVDLEAPSGISTAGDVITAGGNVDFDHATTLTGDIVVDLEDGPNRGLVTFADAVDGTTSGQESLTIGGDLDASASVGGAVALQSLAVSGDSAFAGGITLRTTGSQTYQGEVASTGTITIQAGSGSTVAFQGKTTLGGLVTGTTDTTAYAVSMTGSSVVIANPVTFANTGSVTLGDASTDALTFTGGVTSTAPGVTNLAGVIATTNASASFGTAVLTADATVSTGSGAASFTSTVDGGHALAVNAVGTTTFSAAVGGTTPLVSLTTDAGGTTAINGGSITTSGSTGQVYKDAVTLGKATVLSATGTGPVTFEKTLTGAYALTVTAAGTTTFGDTVSLESLLTDGTGSTAINGGSVTTSGSAGQVYGDDVTLGDDTTLTGDTVTTLGTITGTGHDLTIAGKATLGDAAADVVTGLASLTVTGVATVNASKVTASVIQTWKKTVTLGTDATFEDGVLSFEDPIVGGGYDLTLTGSSVVLGDAPADSVTGVDDLVITGPTVLNGNTITTTGTQTFKGGVTATQATAVVLTGKGIEFKQSLGRGEPGIVPPLTITAGTGGVTFGGDVGTGPGGRPFGTTEIRSEGGVSLAGTLWSNGPVTVASTKVSITGGAANAIRTPNSTIRLEAATGIGTAAVPIGIEAAGVSAATTAGGIFLRAVEPTGNLWIGPAGLAAPAGPIGLDARNTIGVAAGGRIQAGTGGVIATIPIVWSIDRTTDGGPGSLRQILLNLNEVGDANKAGLDARLVFDVPRVMSVPAPQVFTITTSLPEIRAAVEIVGFDVVLDGAAVAGNALALGAAASGSVLSGLTVRNFREYGLQLQSAQNVTVDRISVSGLNLLTSMGVYATGNLAGTRVIGSQFTGGLRGMLLDQARGLRVGSTAAGQANTFTANRAVPSQPRFAGTGIRAQGDCTGTVVEGNTFTANNYGFGFVAARGLALRSNYFARNTIAGIHVDGNCTGSSQTRNVFASAPADRNKANIIRAKGSRGV